jgi:hypothetical protein
MAQAPQFALSDCVLTQAVPQRVNPAATQLETHWPPMQTSPLGHPPEHPPPVVVVSPASLTALEQATRWIDANAAKRTMG